VPFAAIVVAERSVVHGSGLFPGLHSHTCLSGVAGAVEPIVVEATLGVAVRDELELQAAKVQTATTATSTISFITPYVRCRSRTLADGRHRSERPGSNDQRPRHRGSDVTAESSMMHG
jgi:hypothetical protein